METPIIRKGEKRDLPATLELIRELAVYEREPDAVKTTVESMEADGFGPNPVYDLFVCEVDGRIVGIAITYIRYSTWNGQCLYLEDLIVTEQHRGKGYGALLFERCMKETVDKGYVQMQWQVLDWNTPAIEFYEKKYNATMDGEWFNGILTAKQIERAGL